MGIAVGGDVRAGGLRFVVTALGDEGGMLADERLGRWDWHRVDGLVSGLVWPPNRIYPGPVLASLCLSSGKHPIAIIIP